MRRPIPDDIRRFVIASVASVPFLEALLLLRAHPQTCWSGAELARRLYVAPSLGDELLGQLTEGGFAVPGEPAGTLCWNAQGEYAALVGDLAQIYSENVVGITELIHSRQERRAQQFADAFRLRRKDE
jgi:hypothetical protein